VEKKTPFPEIRGWHKREKKQHLLGGQERDGRKKKKGRDGREEVGTLRVDKEHSHLERKEGSVPRPAAARFPP